LVLCDDGGELRVEGILLAHKVLPADKGAVLHDEGEFCHDLLAEGLIEEYKECVQFLLREILRVKLDELGFDLVPFYLVIEPFEEGFADFGAGGVGHAVAFHGIEGWSEETFKAVAEILRAIGEFEDFGSEDDLGVLVLEVGVAGSVRGGGMESEKEGKQEEVGGRLGGHGKTVH